MPFFHKKPQEIEAIQYTGDNIDVITEFVQSGVIVKCLEGSSILLRGNDFAINLQLYEYIAKDDKGELTVIQSNEFENKYIEFIKNDINLINE